MCEKAIAVSETSSTDLQPMSVPKYLELAYDENDERNVDNNLCEAPPINYIDDNRLHQQMPNEHIKDDGYEIPINFDTELDINANNNEVNCNSSKSRTLSNSSTISHKSEHYEHPIIMENCQRSSLILERDHKIYPQKKILASGWV